MKSNLVLTCCLLVLIVMPPAKSQVPLYKSVVTSCSVNDNLKEIFIKTKNRANENATKLAKTDNLILDYFNVYRNIEEKAVSAIFEYTYIMQGRPGYLTLSISLSTDTQKLEYYYFDKTVEKEWGKTMNAGNDQKIIVCSSGIFLKKDANNYIKFPDKTVFNKKKLIDESATINNKLPKQTSDKSKSLKNNYVTAKNALANEVIINGVPNYLWYINCGFTAETMITGYWNDMGYSNFIPGGDSKVGHYWAFTEEECFFGELYDNGYDPLTYYAQAKEYGNNASFKKNSFDHSTYSTEKFWNLYVKMIDSTQNPLEVTWTGEPYGAHATTGIGYKTDGTQRFLILNDTWRNVPYYVDYDLYSTSVNGFTHYYPLNSKSTSTFPKVPNSMSTASFALEALNLDISPALDPASFAYHSFELADLNGDNVEDLIVCNFRNNTGISGVKIYYKNGNTYTENTAFKPKTQWFECPHITRTFDFDNDGDLDIAQTGYWTFVNIFKNDIDSIRQKPLIVDSLGRGFIDLQYGDYDRDGYADLVSTSVDGQIRVYHNNAGKSFTNSFTIDLKSQSCKVKLVDVNNDNYPDLIASTRKGTVVLFYNNRGLFNTTPDFSPAGHGGLAFDVADLNKDGWPDIAASNDGMILIYYNNSGTFSDAPVHVNDNIECYPKDIVASDLNNDTWPELIIGSYNRPNLVFANSNGQISPDPVWQAAFTDPTMNIEVHDNNQGERMLMFGKSRGGTLEFYKVNPLSFNSLTVTPDNRNTEYNEGTCSFSIVSNTVWAVSSDSDWLTAEMKTGSGSASLNVNVTANTTGALRVANITISGNGVNSKIVTITQGCRNTALPELLTVRVTKITKTTALSGGEISSEGNSSIVERGVCWSQLEKPTVDLSTKTQDGEGSGSFISNITGLAEGNVYYVRAYATNSSGTSYGEQVFFRYEKNIIAHYPLLTDGKDETGSNSDMTLTNAPFQNGGIYCNGTYNSCSALTPPINNFNFNSFTIAADFMVTEYLSQPVFVCGTGCRWLGYYLKEDGTVELLYNNANRLSSTKKYSLNKWHTARISYDGTKAHLFIDNAEACSIIMIPDHTVCGAFDTMIGITNFSNSNVFKGYLSELMISSDGSTVGVNEFEESKIKVYPNPAYNVLFIDGLTNTSLVSVYDMTGSLRIRMNLKEDKLDIKNLTNGFYIMEINYNGKRIIKRFIKQI